MIENRGNQRTLTCDGCDKVYDSFPSDEFEEKISAARDEGWTVRLEGRVWRHFCEDCEPGHGGAALAKARRMFGG